MAALTKGQARRLAVMAQTGLARSIYPVHTPLDGDVVFAAATGRKPLVDPLLDLAELGTSAANAVARAVARAVFTAAALPFGPPWRAGVTALHLCYPSRFILLLDLS